MLDAIIKLRSADERDYLESLYSQHYHMLYSVAFSILHDADEASGAVTDAMLSLFSLVAKLRAMEERERIGYLRTTVRHAAYKAYKAMSQQNRTKTVPLDSILFSLPDGGQPPPAELLVQDEEFAQVRAALASLPDLDRQALYLRYCAQLTAKEIAEALHVPSADTLQRRISRARKKVLRLLEEQGWQDEG